MGKPIARAGEPERGGPAGRAEGAVCPQRVRQGPRAKAPARANAIESRHGLTRCRTCRAHVRAGATPSATVCAFCSATVGSAPARVARAAGKGGLLAASLLAISACNGSSSGSQEPTNDPVIEPHPSGGSENTNDSYESEPDDPVAVEADGSPPDERPPDPPPVPAYGVSPPPG